MDATPNFGVTKISEVPSNPQLTLETCTSVHLLLIKIKTLFFGDEDSIIILFSSTVPLYQCFSNCVNLHF